MAFRASLIIIKRDLCSPETLTETRCQSVTVDTDNQLKCWEISPQEILEDFRFNIRYSYLPLFRQGATEHGFEDTAPTDEERAVCTDHVFLLPQPEGDVSEHFSFQHVQMTFCH